MFEIRGRNFRLCDALHRRSFLQVGGLSVAGLTLADILGIRQAQAAGKRRDTSVILFWMAGGPSHLDTYDLKPGMPEEVRGPFSPMATGVPGIDVCHLLPRHARIADRFSLIRSLHHAHGNHDDAAHWVQTGYPQLNARQQGQQHPAQGSAVSMIKGANQPGMPSYVCIPEAYNSQKGFYQRSAYLSDRHDPLAAGGDPSLGNFRPPDFALPAEMTLSRLENRRAILSTLDDFARHVDASGAMETMNDAQLEAFNLVAGPSAREAFDLSREPEPLRARYGRHAWGQSALLARRLVERGVTFVTINLYEADVDWWDDHYQIEKNLRARLPKYDQALATLIEDLGERGLGDDVLVAAFGEFGRAPRIASNGGRGHWPRAASALLSGGGIRTGQVVGATTSDGGEPADRPLGPSDLLATIYQVLGIDPQATLPDRQKRPIPIAPGGQPIRELF